MDSRRACHPCAASRHRGRSRSTLSSFTWWLIFREANAFALCQCGPSDDHRIVAAWPPLRSAVPIGAQWFKAGSPTIRPMTSQIRMSLWSARPVRGHTGSIQRPGRCWVPTRNRGVSKFEDYQRRAAECLRLAHEVRDLTNKKLLLEMAQTWVKLAEQERAAKKSNNKN